MLQLQAMAEKTVALSLRLSDMGKGQQANKLQRSLHRLSRACWVVCKPDRYCLTDWSVVDSKLGLFVPPDVDACYKAHIALLATCAGV